MLQRLGFKHFAYDWRGRAHPDVRRRDRRPQAARRLARRLLGRARRAEPRVADHPRRPQAARGQGPALGPARPRGRQGHGARAGAAGRGRGGEAPAAGRRGGEDRLHRWPSTTTAAGSASRRTSSRSSSGSKARASRTSGIVYNLHHGHDHLDRFPRLLQAIKPYLVASTSTAWTPAATRSGGRSFRSARASATSSSSGSSATAATAGPIGILGHTDGRRRGAAARQPRRPRLAGAAARRQARRPAAEAPHACPAPSAAAKARRASTTPTSAEAGRERSLAARPGRRVILGAGPRCFSIPKFSCSSCHKVGTEGGASARS